ncbi:hypothetical protein TNCV_4257151 [Trichonephila clavipes]|nr:hypothetical protein TNCV_4257151 [Trichonephila clavipes]
MCSFVELCTGQECGFQILNDDEIVTSRQKVFDPVDDETYEDEDTTNNESSKGPSNADTFSERPCSEKTKVYSEK